MLDLILVLGRGPACAMDDEASSSCLRLQPTTPKFSRKTSGNRLFRKGGTPGTAAAGCCGPSSLPLCVEVDSCLTPVRLAVSSIAAVQVLMLLQAVLLVDPFWRRFLPVFLLKLDLSREIR